MSISVQTANPSVFFASATSTLSSAASSGLFTANLVSACQSIGITNTATVIGSTTSGLQIIQPPTINPTFRPSVNITNIELTSKFGLWSIETIVGITIIGFIFVSSILYYCYHHNLSSIINDNYNHLRVSTVDGKDVNMEDVNINSYNTITDDICDINDVDLVIDDRVIDDRVIDVIPSVENDYQIIVNE